jgi:hypothetical protein
LLSGALDDLLSALPEGDLAATPLGDSPLGAPAGFGPGKKPAARRGPSLWDSTWFLIGVGILLGLVLIGAGFLYFWLSA